MEQVAIKDALKIAVSFVTATLSRRYGDSSPHENEFIKLLTGLLWKMRDDIVVYPEYIYGEYGDLEEIWIIAKVRGSNRKYDVEYLLFRCNVYKGAIVSWRPYSVFVIGDSLLTGGNRGGELCTL